MRYLLILAIVLQGCAAHKPLHMIIADTKPHDGCRFVEYTSELQHKVWECSDTKILQVKQEK